MFITYFVLPEKNLENIVLKKIRERIFDSEISINDFHSFKYFLHNENKSILQEDLRVLADIKDNNLFECAFYLILNKYRLSESVRKQEIFYNFISNYRWSIYHENDFLNKNRYVKKDRV